MPGSGAEHARSDRERMAAVTSVDLGEAQAAILGQACGGLEVDAVQQDRELLATQAAEVVDPAAERRARVAPPA